MSGPTPEKKLIFFLTNWEIEYIVDTGKSLNVSKHNGKKHMLNDYN